MEVEGGQSGAGIRCGCRNTDPHQPSGRYPPDARADSNISAIIFKNKSINITTILIIIVVLIIVGVGEGGGEGREGGRWKLMINN